MMQEGYGERKENHIPEKESAAQACFAKESLAKLFAVNVVYKVYNKADRIDYKTNCHCKAKNTEDNSDCVVRVPELHFEYWRPALTKEAGNPQAKSVQKTFSGKELARQDAHNHT